MKMPFILLLAAIFALSPLDGAAGEKQIADVKDLAGRWRGWVSEVAGDEWATMNVSADGSYKASAMSTSTVGKFYLQDGKLRYRSRRVTPLAMPSAEMFGTASVSEDKGKTVLTLIPEDPNYLGKAEYERVEQCGSLPIYARPTRPAPASSSRLRGVPDAVIRPLALGSAHAPRLLVRRRSRRRGDAPPGLRPSVDPVRRARLARDVLHDRDGALTHERDRHRVGAHAVARDAAGGVGGTEPAAVQGFDPGASAPRRRARRSEG